MSTRYALVDEAGSQTAAVLAWLKKGNTLTQLEALRLFGTLRLASIIHSLKRKGVPIDTWEILTPNGSRVGKYKLGKVPGQTSLPLTLAEPLPVQFAPTYGAA